MTPLEVLLAGLAGLAIVAATRLVDILLPKNRHLKWIDSITVADPDDEDECKRRRTDEH